MRILDPVLNDLTPRHLEIFWRYQVVRTGVDFCAATCFVAGSACFFYASLSVTADWLFLIGSLLFAVKPTIDVVRSAHLGRLPAGGAGSPGGGARLSGGRWPHPDRVRASTPGRGRAGRAAPMAG